MDFAKQIGEELNLNYDNVSAAISLLDEGFTVPFIAILFANFGSFSFSKYATKTPIDHAIRLIFL